MEIIKKYWWILAAAFVYMMMGKKKKPRRRMRRSPMSRMNIMRANPYNTSRGVARSYRSSMRRRPVRRIRRR